MALSGERVEPQHSENSNFVGTALALAFPSKYLLHEVSKVCVSFFDRENNRTISIAWEFFAVNLVVTLNLSSLFFTTLLVHPRNSRTLREPPGEVLTLLAMAS